MLFDGWSRGRYSTDASIYQIEPVGVVVPETEEDAITAFRIAVDEGVPVLPRGGGTSQSGSGKSSRSERQGAGGNESPAEKSPSR